MCLALHTEVRADIYPPCAFLSNQSTHGQATQGLGLLSADAERNIPDKNML